MSCRKRDTEEWLTFGTASVKTPALLLLPRGTATEALLVRVEATENISSACPPPGSQASKQTRIVFSLSLLQNPNPGLFAVKHPLTYAETLIDYYLCTHPKYKFTKESHSGSSIPVTQKQFLHHTVMPAPCCREGRGTGMEGHHWN